MRILVTGANGYIGRHVVKTLLDSDNEVIAADLVLNNVDERAEKKVLNLFSLPEDVDLYTELGSPDVCLHMAWRNGFVHNHTSHIEDLSAHFLFMKTLIDCGLKHLAVMGTMHEVGYWEGAIDEETPCNPISLYGIAKDSLRRSVIAYCNSRGCTLQWLRCFYILGDDRKNNSIFCKLLNAAEEGKKTFPFTTGRNKYDFIDVDMLASQIAAVITQNEVAGIINCCSGEPVSLAERVERFITDNNLEISLEYGAFPDRPYDSPCIYGDPTKINRILNIHK